MQRLNIEKNEAVADLIERILEVQDQEIVLVVPKGSHLVSSPSNFRLIAREAGVLEKNISIESVDQDVLAHARAAGLAASHPLFDDPSKMGEGQSLSDIRPRGSKVKPARGKKLKVEVEPEPEDEEQDEEDDDSEVSMVSTETEEEVYEEEIDNRDDEDEERYDTLEPRRSRGKKVLVWGVIILLLIGAGMWFTAYAFGKATVNISFNESPWEYNGTVTASVAAKNMDVDTATIPAELVGPQSQNLSPKFFPATGHTTGGQKARGTITIVNAYGAQPQELVATTRFATPDGKIYRLDIGTVVPGATVDSNGKVTASSSIKAAVTADQPGSDYNVGAVAHLTIPGFQGTPKAAGFYGVLSDGTSGGSSTGGASATAEDIAKAKSEMSSALNSTFQTVFLASIPEDLKVLPGALVFSTTTFSIGPVNAQGQFSVTPTSILRAFEFREADVMAFLNDKARTESSDSNSDSRELKDLTINYSNVSPNFSKKQMTFTVNAKAISAPKFNPTSFAASVAGKSQDEARQMIQALPGLSSANVSLWPAWLWTLPANSSKISVKVQ